MIPLAYSIVGIFYHSGDASVLGSIYFLIIYAALTFVLWILGKVQFALWAILLMTAIVVGIIILIKHFSEAQ